MAVDWAAVAPTHPTIHDHDKSVVHRFDVYQENYGWSSDADLFSGFGSTVGFSGTFLLMLQQQHLICSQRLSDIPEKHVLTKRTRAAPAAVKNPPHSAADHDKLISFVESRKI